MHESSPRFHIVCVAGSAHRTLLSIRIKHDVPRLKLIMHGLSRTCKDHGRLALVHRTRELKWIAKQSGETVALQGVLFTQSKNKATSEASIDAESVVPVGVEPVIVLELVLDEVLGEVVLGEMVLDEVVLDEVVLGDGAGVPLGTVLAGVVIGVLVGTLVLVGVGAIMVLVGVGAIMVLVGMDALVALGAGAVVLVGVGTGTDAVGAGAEVVGMLEVEVELDEAVEPEAATTVMVTFWP